MTRREKTDTDLPRPALTRDRDSLIRRLLAVGDAASLAVALAFGVIALGDDRLTLAALAAPVLLVLVAKTAGLYDRDEHLLHKTTLDEVPTLFGIASVAALLLWLSGDLLVSNGLDREQILGTWALLFVLMVAARALARNLALRLAPSERCLVVGDPRFAAELREKIALTHSVKAEVVGVIPPPDSSVADGDSTPDQLLEELQPLLDQRIDRVVLATGPEVADELLYVITQLRSFGVKVSVWPEASRVAGSSVELDHLHGVTLLGVRRFEITHSSRIVKRTFDLIGTALALVVLSVPMLVIAIAIRLDSSGPALFRQPRVGRRGRQFEMLKFRSMCSEAEQQKEELFELNEGAEGLFKIPDDPRLTRIGRLIRRWSLDELPQLINVLRGEMSLVGPRPLIPEEDAKIEGHYRHRLELAPGITGHWQILGSSATIPLDEMVKLDYLYVANWSLWNDVRLLLRTVPFVLGRRGI